MGVRRLNLMFVLAVMVAVSPLRHAEQVHRHVDIRSHLHTHAHTHDGRTHTHHHVHRSVGDEHEAAEGHHCGFDHLCAPKIVWVRPRRVDVDGPPTTPASPAAVVVSAFAGEPHGRAKPPPSRYRETHSIRTVVLQV